MGRAPMAKPADTATPKRQMLFCLLIREGRKHLTLAQIAAELDAGIGARNVEETGAVGGADLDVFDRLGLERKIGGASPAGRDQHRG